MKKKPESVRHSINNLLAAINLSCEMLLRGLAGEVTKEQQKYLKNILADSNKIRDRIKHLKST